MSVPYFLALSFPKELLKCIIAFMKRFDPDRYYLTTDPELALLATRGTLSQWRHRGEGPPYVKFGNRILYEGRELNRWIDEHVVHPVNPRAEKG